jgi:hypothetical protein
MLIYLCILYLIMFEITYSLIFYLPILISKPPNLQDRTLHRFDDGAIRTEYLLTATGWDVTGTGLKFERVALKSPKNYMLRIQHDILAACRLQLK